MHAVRIIKPINDNSNQKPQQHQNGVRCAQREKHEKQRINNQAYIIETTTPNIDSFKNQDLEQYQAEKSKYV